MAKNKSLKKALITGVISTVLCTSMFVGTTFAWFTDSVTSNSNIIQTGTLNVGMYWAEGNEDPESVTWKDASEGAIFNYDKWEPGYVEAKHIKVTNEGTLALKYKLVIVPNGEVSALADVIDVYYINGATQVTREALANATPVGTLRDMIEDPDGAAYGYLLAEDKSTETLEGEQTVTIALKMREEAGNEYQGKSIGSDFSIQLFATQYTYENDSFDNTYDKNADYDGEISNATSLVAAFANGGSYKIVSDIVLDKYVTVPEGVTVALDLNGNTVSAVSGNVIRNNGDLTLANGTLEGTTTYTVNNESTNGVVSIENVKSVNGGFFNAGSMIVNNCEITNTASGKHALVNSGDASTSLVVNGGTYSTTSANAIIYAYSGAIEVNDGSFTQIGSSYMIDGSGITINGGTFTDDDGKWAIRGTHTIFGGTFNFDPSSYVAEGYVATKNADGIYTVSKKIVPDGATFVFEGLYQDADENYLITNATGLATMGTMVADEETYDADGTWILYTDIDMTGVDWAPINGFHGTFDGNGKTISNLTVSTDGAAGLFGKNNLNGDGTATKPVIKNLTVSNANITGNEGVAVVAGNIGYADIEKVTVIGATVNGNKYVGGIIGTAYTTGGVVISDCSVIESTIKAEGTNANGKVGGIGGFVANGTVKGNKVEACTISGPECVGGIVGRGGSGETVASIYGNTVSNNSVTGTDTTTVGEQIGDNLNVKETE